MAHVLLAGLPTELTPWIARRLPNISVQATCSGIETLEALNREAVSLLLIDHSLATPNALDVLQKTRAGIGLEKLPVVYCLDKSQARDLPGQLVDRLGVRQLLFHPLEREELARQVATTLGIALPPAQPEASQARQQTMAAVAALWEQFKDSIMSRVTVLEEAIMALLGGVLEDDMRRQAEREAHKLAGSVGTFGFAEASRLAREMEHMLQGGETLEPAQALHLSELVLALRQALESPPAVQPPPEAAPTAPDARPVLLAISSDTALNERLVTEATARGVRAECVTSLLTARQAIARARPDVALLDLSLSSATEDSLAVLSHLVEQTPPVPVLVLTAQDTFTDRVEVARLGGRGFFQRSTSPTHLVESVTQTLQQIQSHKAKVLVVDDDPQILATLRTLLTPRDITLTTLDDPLQFWDVLAETAPDLLVLDVDMPHISGIELCRVVRSDPCWRELPVLFLTGRTDTDTVQRVFAVGADDFVSKPIIGPELMTRITNRLERAQLFRSLAETDPLTGIANRRKSSQVLGQFLRLAARHQQPLSLGVLDLDHFRRVNTQYGHAGGDDVLRRLGDLLQRCFRSEDIVARWGGEEFVVGMYSATRDVGVHRLAEALEAFRREEFQGPDGTRFHVTFSAGVAEYPTDGAELQALYCAADAALYQAKEMGRDRVLPAGWRPAVEHMAEYADVIMVDDDDTLAGLLLHALETRGYRAQWLKNGQEAVERLGGPQPPLRARVVLLDVDMPGLNGLAVLRRLAQDGVLQHTRVIMLTFRAAETEVLEALELGAFDHVAKPFSVPILMQRIRRTMQG